MADVTYGGLGQNQPALNIEVEYGATGRPVFPASDVVPGPAALASNIGIVGGLRTLLTRSFSVGDPVPSAEIRQNGRQQLDPNDNRSLHVESIPSIGTSFPGVATTLPNIVPDPNDSRNIIVETFPGGVVFPNTEVKFITGAILNVSP